MLMNALVAVRAQRALEIAPLALRSRPPKSSALLVLVSALVKLEY